MNFLRRGKIVCFDFHSRERNSIENKRSRLVSLVIAASQRVFAFVRLLRGLSVPRPGEDVRNRETEDPLLDSILLSFPFYSLRYSFLPA